MCGENPHATVPEHCHASHGLGSRVASAVGTSSVPYGTCEEREIMRNVNMVQYIIMGR